MKGLGWKMTGEDEQFEESRGCFQGIIFLMHLNATTEAYRKNKHRAKQNIYTVEPQLHAHVVSVLCHYT